MFKFNAAVKKLIILNTGFPFITEIRNMYLVI